MTTIDKLKEILHCKYTKTLGGKLVLTVDAEEKSLFTDDIKTFQEGLTNTYLILKEFSHDEILDKSTTIHYNQNIEFAYNLITMLSIFDKVTKEGN